MRTIKIWTFAVVAFVSVMLAETSQVIAETFLVAEEQQMLTLVNSSRTEAGLPALGDDSALKTIARRQSQAMAAAGYIYHTPDLAEQAKAHGINYSLLGENVGVGPSVASVQQAFMNSQHHRENIMDSRFTKVGIGGSTAGGYLYFSQNFAALRGTTAAPKPAAPAPAPAAQPAVASKPAAPKPRAEPKPKAPPAPAKPAPAPVAPTPAPEQPTVDYVKGLDRFPTMAGAATGAGEIEVMAASKPITRESKVTLPRMLGGMALRFFSAIAFWK